MDLAGLNVTELFVLYAKIAEELRARGVTRTSNNLTGDLAEHFFCKAFGWKQQCNSHAHVDAVAPDGMRYQIKARRVTRRSNSRQLSAIRNLMDDRFDFLAGALLTEDYKIYKAALIPRAVVMERSKYITYTNSHRFFLHDDIWDAPGVRDVTPELRAVTL